MKKLLVFDIDQTLVDSSVRENFCYFGDVLDIPLYHKQKYDKELGIFSDTLLPLGHWLEANATQYDFVLCTARNFEYIDFESLYSLMPHTLYNAKHIMCRNNAIGYGGNTCEASDNYKRPLLSWVKTQYNRELVVVDDCRKVLNIALQDGHNAICARDLWHLSHEQIEARLHNALY